MPSNLSVNNLRVHDEHITYTRQRGTMPPPPPPEPDRQVAKVSASVPAPKTVVKSTTTKASSVKHVATPTPFQQVPPKPRRQRVEAHAEVWVNDRLYSVPDSTTKPLSPAKCSSAQFKAPKKTPSKAPSQNQRQLSPSGVAALKSAHAAAIHPTHTTKGWVPPPPVTENMALTLMSSAIPLSPGSAKSSSSKASNAKTNKGMEVVKTSACVRTTPSHVPGAASMVSSKAPASQAGESRQAGSDIAKSSIGDNKQKDMMVTIEETYTRKVSFPVIKGEKVKYGVRRGDIGGTRGFFIDG